MVPMAEVSDATSIQIDMERASDALDRALQQAANTGCAACYRDAVEAQGKMLAVCYRALIQEGLTAAAAGHILELLRVALLRV